MTTGAALSGSMIRRRIEKHVGSSVKIVSLLAVLCAASPVGGMGNSDVQRLVTSLTGELRRHEVSSIELLHIPYETRFRSRIDSGMLVKLAKDRCPLAMSHELQSGLADAIEHSKIQPAGGDADLRWGLLFHGLDPQHDRAVFLDGRYIFGSGHFGIIDGAPIRLNSSLLEWAERTFIAACPSLRL